MPSDRNVGTILFKFNGNRGISFFHNLYIEMKTLDATSVYDIYIYIYMYYIFLSAGLDIAILLVWVYRQAVSFAVGQHHLSTHMACLNGTIMSYCEVHSQDFKDLITFFIQNSPEIPYK